MTESPPLLLIPGLNLSPRLYAAQIPALWRIGPVMVANHARAASMEAIARQILAEAPPRFALAGLSMGGYIAFEMIRQTPERIARLALLDTSARADTEEQTKLRRARIDEVRAGRFREMVQATYPLFVHPSRLADPGLRAQVAAMAEETGEEAFLRQIEAIIARPDSRPDLARIRCPTLVICGDKDQLTPPVLAQEMAGGIGGARLVILPECGHLAPIERPEMVTSLMESWLRD